VLEAAKVKGVVVARVDGHAITADQVSALPELAPREAVRRLASERLLMAEASRRGYGTRRAVLLAERQALAQAVLADEEERVTVSTEELRAAYEAQRDRFHRPERRTSVHVLARVPEDAEPALDAQARAFAAHVIAEFAAADAVEDVVARYRGFEHAAFQVVAEDIPAAGQQASFVKPYLDALFSLEDTGVVPEPVHTVFGWHAIAVTKIEPESSVPFEQAAEALRSELLIDKRKHHVDAFTAQLRRRVGVAIDPEAIARLRAMTP
jgi:parvulin-like peptidyl-prolyl isomerase